MIEYNEYGNAQGRTHDMDPGEARAREAWRVIHQATDSLLNWGLVMHKEVARRQDSLSDALADLEATRQYLRIAREFAGWVADNAEDGIPASELKKRAVRAVLGQERAESHPPQPM